MTPTDDTRRPVVEDGSGESSSNFSSGLARRFEDCTRPWHTTAYAYRVVGVRGRERLALVVAACPFCRSSHMHSAVVDFTSGKRTADCHGGRYVVQLQDET